MEPPTTVYEVMDKGDERILSIEGKEYKTYYSKRIVEAIIARKGVGRAPQYLSHKDERSVYLGPLFEVLNNSASRLKVLEVGCSSGHITEFLNEQKAVGEIHSYDVDKAFVDIAQIKKDELNLQKVKSIKHLTNQTSQNLPYESTSFDLVIVLAVVEHLPFENRYRYIDEYYRVLKQGGLVGFWDTPNKFFPYESHNIGLPFLQWLPPQWAYIYAKMIRRKKMRNVSFTNFTRPDTGWRNSSYYELLPKTRMIEIEDVSHEFGYINVSVR